ncbi:hemophore-related protein [Mycobacterium hodleri]|uniref:Hemophore-related protein n=1 Tax=Mycolicibacterium hodleri TaxID=49897 RepID=A0A544VSZ9_9MYCO|nr:heme-binding protein [Mycolicibacterium hodleri]TQR83109.1 hemophore-related protein [Mycolicibacterium hodleri]
MLLSALAGRRAVAGAMGASAIAGAMLFGALPSALADDPALNPPNCSAADLAGVSSGVSASTSAYLFTHPDVNYFFTSLEGLPREEIRTKVADYMNANPMTKADLTGIRQPLVDLKNRCGAAPAPAIP